jgi:hypothetical protein
MLHVVDQYFRKVDVFRPAALAEEDGFIGKNAIDKKALSNPAPVEPSKATPAAPIKQVPPEPKLVPAEPSK